MPKKLESCEHIDFSPLIPDNPQPPLCEVGHGWSSDCMKSNSCPDYKPSIGYSLEEVKKRIGEAGGRMENRLLTEEERIECEGINEEQWLLEAQDAKTASIKDAEYQKKIEEIFKEIESQMAIERCDPEVMPYFTDYFWMPVDVWQSLKDRIREENK